MTSVTISGSGARERKPEAPVPLTPLEVAVIDLFQGALRMLGLPKSIGEIYGLLFASPRPLPLDELVQRLRISKGSASQGLKVLRAVGAVKATYVAGDRRDHYAAEVELKRLAIGFIREQVEPRLESGETKLARIQELVRGMPAEEPDAEFYRDRAVRLASWHGRARGILPLLTTMIE